MKKSELIELLLAIDDDPDVFVSTDEEGNGFSSLCAVEDSMIYQEGYEINVVHPDDIAGYDEDELERAIVLWP